MHYCIAWINFSITCCKSWCVMDVVNMCSIWWISLPFDEYLDNSHIHLMNIIIIWWILTFNVSVAIIVIMVPNLKVNIIASHPYQYNFESSISIKWPLINIYIILSQNWNGYLIELCSWKPSQFARFNVPKLSEEILIYQPSRHLENNSL